MWHRPVTSLPSDPTTPLHSTPLLQGLYPRDTSTHVNLETDCKMLETAKHWRSPAVHGPALGDALRGRPNIKHYKAVKANETQLHATTGINPGTVLSGRASQAGGIPVVVFLLHKVQKHALAHMAHLADHHPMHGAVSIRV